MSKCGKFGLIFLILSGCASNCKVKEEVFGVLRRQNIVLEGILNRRKQKSFQEQIVEFGLLPSEESMIAGLSAVVKSNNILLDGGHVCK
ncbi:hypothetical protein K2X05_06650 [bacterium]|nr:hypothetical protein [bacterium]